MLVNLRCQKKTTIWTGLYIRYFLPFVKNRSLQKIHIFFYLFLKLLCVIDTLISENTTTLFCYSMYRRLDVLETMCLVVMDIIVMAGKTFSTIVRFPRLRRWSDYEYVHPWLLFVPPFSFCSQKKKRKDTLLHPLVVLFRLRPNEKVFRKFPIIGI